MFHSTCSILMLIFLSLFLFLGKWNELTCKYDSCHEDWWVFQWDGIFFSIWSAKYYKQHKQKKNILSNNYVALNGKNFNCFWMSDRSFWHTFTRSAARIFCFLFFGSAFAVLYSFILVFFDFSVCKQRLHHFAKIPPI